MAKIEKFYNKKEKKSQYRSRFQINNKEFYPTADTQRELTELIDEIKVQERREKRNLAVPDAPGPTLEELFDKVLPTVEKPHQRTLSKRVFENFLALLPAGIRVKEIRKSHFQMYIDWRLPQPGFQNRQQIKRNTIYKELYAVSSALGKGELYYSTLESWKKPDLPKSTEKKASRQEARRKRIVSRDSELALLLTELRKPRSGKQTVYTEHHRRALADDLEFRFETGLRRKEVARLEPKQYFSDEQALRNVKRWKTGTVTKFFPLTAREREIVENRLKQHPESGYIFTSNGEPVESNYRTLKIVCKELGITYGRYVDDGFVPHDLRHNFASEVIQHTDIETARELLEHSNIGQTGDYLHTNEKRMKQVMQRRDGFDLKREIVELYKEARRGKIKTKPFVERMRKLVVF